MANPRKSWGSAFSWDSILHDRDNRMESLERVEDLPSREIPFCYHGHACISFIYRARFYSIAFGREVGRITHIVCFVTTAEDSLSSIAERNRQWPTWRYLEVWRLKKFVRIHRTTAKKAWCRPTKNRMQVAVIQGITCFLAERFLIQTHTVIVAAALVRREAEGDFASPEHLTQQSLAERKSMLCQPLFPLKASTDCWPSNKRLF